MWTYGVLFGNTKNACSLEYYFLSSERFINLSLTFRGVYAKKLADLAFKLSKSFTRYDSKGNKIVRIIVSHNYSSYMEEKDVLNLKKFFFITFSVLIIFIFCPMYKFEEDKYDRLNLKGVETHLFAVKPFRSKFDGVLYAEFHFTTKDNKIIRKSEKCSDKKGFSKYINAKVIYNPENPDEYKLSSDYYNHSKTRNLIILIFSIAFFIIMSFLGIFRTKAR